MSIIIDPGHGGVDPGAVGNGIIEKSFVLEVSLYQYRRFKELGVPVKLTRSTDKTLTPSERANIVKNSGMRHCISNHVNAGGGDGAEIIHSILSNSTLPHTFAAELVKEGQNLRRVFSRKGSNGRDYYFMHRLTGSVETNIIEYGFLDSKGDDVAQLKAKQLQYAEAIVRAYCKYIGKTYKAPGNVKEPIEDAVDNVLPDGIIKPSLTYNAEVRVIQIYLNYFLKGNPLEVDGYYGPQTEAAIKKFQKARGISADGIYGPNTKRELQQYYAETIAKTKPKGEAIFTIQVGAFSSRENAEKYLKEVQKHFKDAFIRT